MENELYSHTLKRIAIIGLPGSGKSTFAIALGKVLNIPVHHLDKYMFAGRSRINQDKFLAAKETLLKESSWIIEGCSITTLEMRFAKADTIIYLNFPRLVCIWRICKRMFASQSHLSETGCLSSINWPLIKYIWNFERDKRQKIEELRKLYPKVNFAMIHSSADLKKYLKTLTNR